MNYEQGKTEWELDELEGLREQVDRIAQQPGMSRAEICRRSGVAESTLSQFMSGTYNGKISRVALDLQRWLDAHAKEQEVRRQAPPEPKFVRTPTSQKVQAALQHAQVLSDMALISGPPGTGKTAALEQYALVTPNVLKVTSSPAVSTASAVLAAFMERYSTANYRSERSLTGRSNVVRGLLRKGMLLIVDEAQHLSMGALEELRAIHDATKCGLALIGNETVLSRVQGGSRDPAYAQLFGRVGWRVQIKKAHVANDAAPVLATMGVDAAEVVAVAADIARREDLRVAVKVTRSAMVLAGGANENLDAKHMRAAYRQLAGEAS